MTGFTSYMIYLGVIITAAITSLVKYKRLDSASKIFSLLLLLTLLSETVAYLAAKYCHNNFPVYHVFAPIQLLMVSLYFNYSIEHFKQKKIGIYIGLAGIPIAILNSIFLQPTESFNTYFLMYEGLCTIFMCLYAFNRMFLNDDVDLLRYPHFWFTFLLLTFWSITYINWGVYEFMRFEMMDILYKMRYILWFVNIVTYTGIAFVFLFYRKNIAQRE